MRVCRRRLWTLRSWCGRRTPATATALQVDVDDEPRLDLGDVVREQADAALRDDVGDAIADLNPDNSTRPRDAQHGNDVHNGVGAP